MNQHPVGLLADGGNKTEREEMTKPNELNADPCDPETVWTACKKEVEG